MVLSPLIPAASNLPSVLKQNGIELLFGNAVADPGLFTDRSVIFHNKKNAKCASSLEGTSMVSHKILNS